MKILVQFDSYAMDYEIKGEIGGMGGIDGVEAVTLMRKIAGDAPHFCIELEIDDEKMEPVREKLDRYRSQYGGQISNTVVTTYRTV